MASLQIAYCLFTAVASATGGDCRNCRLLPCSAVVTIILSLVTDIGSHVHVFCSRLLGLGVQSYCHRCFFVGMRIKKRQAAQAPVRTSSNRFVIKLDLVTCCRSAGMVNAAISLTGSYDAQLGPYPVGVTTMQFKDKSRTSDSGARSLLTEIFYPAEDGARSLPRNKFSDYLPQNLPASVITQIESKHCLGFYRRGIKLEELDSRWRNAAIRNARLRCGDAPASGWPLIIFSHDSGGTRFLYLYLLEMLASHGFIVASCDHTGNARFTFVDGEFVPMAARTDVSPFESLKDRPLDLKFLIDEMSRLNLGGDERFAGRIDCRRVGAAGMSMGGTSILAASEIDDRIACVLPLASGVPRVRDRKNVATPAMVVVGGKDRVVPKELNHRYYDMTSTDSYWLEVTHAAHWSFNSADQFDPPWRKKLEIPPKRCHGIVNSYALAFFNVHLCGQQQFREFLQRNHYEPSGDLHYEQKATVNPRQPRSKL